MKLKQSKSTVQQPEPDTYMARLVGITDLGLQPGYEWGGKTIKPTYKLRLSYELVNSEMDDGRPFWVHEEVTNSDNEKSTIMARIASLKADPTNPASMINKPCFVTIVKNKNDYSVISKTNGVSSVPNGMEVPELRNKSFVFDLENPDLDLYNDFPEFIQEKITSHLEYEGSQLQQMLDNPQY